jgi:hypothetical protein
MPQEPAPADQIEATPEMVWAGLDAYLDYGGQDSDDLMVAEIYRAMEEIRVIKSQEMISKGQMIVKAAEIVNLVLNHSPLRRLKNR